MGNVRVVRFIGGLLLLVGLVFVAPGIASATARGTSRPVVSVAPSRILPGARDVTVSGSGLPSGGSGAISECSSASPQPTVVVHGVPTPVSCSRPRRVHFSANGTLAPVGVHAVDGTVGPPGPGTDNSGSAASADAASYPCPPTAPQIAAGARCFLRLTWGAGGRHQRLRALTFAGTGASSGAQGNDKSTTPSTTAHAHAGDPSTTAHAHAHAHAHASEPATPVMTVKPHVDLTNGQTVVVRASGLPHNGTGFLVECSAVTPQTTVSVSGVPVPVSCTDPRSQRWTFSPGGRLRATFQIVTGVVGPPRSGSTKTGRSADAVARRYPCPPTAAQTTAGYHCYLELVSGADHHRLVQALTFASSSTAATSPTPPAQPVTTAHTTSAAKATLPFTGASIEQLAVTGVLLVILGSGLLLVGESPRRSRRRRFAAVRVDP